MKNIFICLSVLFSNHLWSQVTDHDEIISYCQHVVRTLAHDSFQGREASSVYEKKAAEFIKAEFKKSTGKTARYQYFEYRLNDSAETRRSVNVFYYQDNKKDSTIIIGAHYDHIGLGGPLSMSLMKKGVHNGADDNASGVALLLSLAKRMNYWENKKYNYLFVAYSAHELGLYGSESFEKATRKKFKKIALVLNFDMVGRMHPEDKWLKIYGLENESAIVDSLKSHNKNVNFRIEPDSFLRKLDTKAFAAKGIKCLSFSTGIQDDYHKISDVESKINYQGILLTQLVIESILKNYFFYK